MNSFILRASPRSVPDWEKPCWVVALRDTTSADELELYQLARGEGWSGKTTGLELVKVISLAWGIIGHKPDLSLTRPAVEQKFTPKTLSSSALVRGKTGLVFTKGHVMPMVSGKLSNFNGHGDEPVIVIALTK